MSGTTPILGLTYQTLSDSNATETQFQTLVDAIDVVIFPRFTSAANRDATYTSPATGAVAYDSTTKQLVVKQATAGQWQQANARVIVKASDETVNNSSTQQDDNDFVFTNLEANAVYRVVLDLYVTGNNTADFATSWTLPASATIVRFAQGTSTAGTTYTNIVPTVATALGYGVEATTGVHIRETALITLAGTAGTATFRWAQNVANASNTVLKAKSMARIRRVK